MLSVLISGLLLLQPPSPTLVPPRPPHTHTPGIHSMSAFHPALNSGPPKDAQDFLFSFSLPKLIPFSQQPSRLMPPHLSPFLPPFSLIGVHSPSQLGSQLPTSVSWEQGWGGGPTYPLSDRHLLRTRTRFSGTKSSPTPYMLGCSLSWALGQGAGGGSCRSKGDTVGADSSEG